MNEDFLTELHEFLVDTTAYVDTAYGSCTRRETGKPYHWVMSPEWAADVRHLTTKTGRPLWQPATDITKGYSLFCMRVEIHDEGSVPHLEAGE